MEPFKTSELIAEISFLKRMLGEDPDTPTYRCRNQIAATYQETIRTMSKIKETKGG